MTECVCVEMKLNPFSEVARPHLHMVVQKKSIVCRSTHKAQDEGALFEVER